MSCNMQALSSQHTILKKMAERTGLEPATTGVTGQYSKPTELPLRRKYQAIFCHGQVENWWVLQGSNLRPAACKAAALPTELNTLPDSNSQKF